MLLELMMFRLSTKHSAEPLMSSAG